MAGMPAGCRHLYHQVGTLHRRPQPQRLLHGAFAIVGQVGRAFQADITVLASRLVVDRTQHVGSATDIGDRQVLIDVGDTVIAQRLKLSQRLRVFVGLADCLLEDRRIRGYALQTVALDERAQFTFLDQAALQIVQPKRLTAHLELLQRIHAVCILHFAICSLAAACTFSGVKPNFVSRSLIGADEPKVCMPILAPAPPT